MVKKMKNKEIEKLKPKIVGVLKKNGVKKAGIFGSYATGKQKKSSDIDILVEINKDASLLDFIEIKLELEDNLKKKVDLVEYKTIKPRIKDKIAREKVRLI